MGAFEGSCDHTKVTINPSSTVSVVFSDNGSNEVGEVVVQSILQGSDYSKLVNLSEMVRVGSTLGWVSGGTITRTIGLNVNVDAGDGFLLGSTDSQVYETPWNATGITLMDNM